MASIARDVVVEMTPPRDDNARQVWIEVYNTSRAKKTYEPSVQHYYRNIETN